MNEKRQARKKRKSKIKSENNTTYIQVCIAIGYLGLMASASAQQGNLLSACIGPRSTWNNCIGTLDYSSAQYPNTTMTGEFKNGVKNGIGVIQYGDGVIIVQMYRDDKIDGISTMYNQDRTVNSVFEYKDGKEIAQLSPQQALPLPQNINPAPYRSSRSTQSFGKFPMNQRVPPVAFCDQTVFMVNGQPLDFEDVLLDGNRAIEHNKRGVIEAYVYLDRIKVADDPYGTSYAFMYKGTECYLSPPNNRMINANWRSPIQVIFNPQRSSISDDQYREIRRTLLKAQQSGQAGALVKITGSFDLFRDDFKLFLNGTSAQIIDVK
jgi:hypothetical protein